MAYLPGKVLIAALLVVVAAFSVQTSTAEEPIVHVKCETTKGPIRIEIHPDWAPIGVERYLELLDAGFWTNVGLTRVVKGFLVQFGIGENPQEWSKYGRIKDDPDLHIPVKRGTIAYAGGGQDSRTTQIWIAFQDSSQLGKAFWERPIGEVVREDMHVVDSWYSGYGDMEVFGGHGPDQGKQSALGNKYLKEGFPLLDYMLSCTRMDPEGQETADDTGVADDVAADVADDVVAEVAADVANDAEDNMDTLDLQADTGKESSSSPSSTSPSSSTSSPSLSRYVPTLTISFLVLLVFFISHRYKKLCEVQKRKAVESV